MATLRYCKDCRAKTAAGEETCPFCGGELCDLLPDTPTQSETATHKTAPAGLSHRAYFNECVDAQNKRSMRAAANLLLFSVLISVVTAGESILSPIVIAIGAALAVLAVIIYFTYSFLLSALSALLCVGSAIFGFAVYGSPVYAIGLIGAAYATFRFFPLFRDFCRYKKLGSADYGLDRTGYKPYPVFARVLLCAAFVGLTVACGIFFYRYQLREYKKYEDFSLGAWTDSTYQNDFAKVSFELPDGWTKWDDAALAEKNASSFPGSAENEARFCYWLDGPEDAQSYLELYKQSRENYTVKDYIQVVYENRKAAYDKAAVDYAFGQNFTLEWNGESYTGVAFRTADPAQKGYHVLLAKTHYRYTIAMEFTAPDLDSIQHAIDDFGIIGVTYPD